VSRLLRTALAALTLTLIAAPAAAARDLAPGLSRTDLKSIIDMAGTRWPKTPCQGVMVYSLPASRMRGLSAAPALGRRCTVLLSRGTHLTATGWCRALEGVFARLARGTTAAAWPYDCTTAVGPVPTKPKLLTVPGVGPDEVQQAYQVASAHWPGSGCQGREQLRWATPEQLAAGSGGEPAQGLTTMGIAHRRDPRCIVYVNASISDWTPYELCLVIEHEFGHLKGLGHATSGVMAPVDAHSPDCEAAFPPATPEAPPAVPGATARSS
jgi:hypothetical protein